MTDNRKNEEKDSVGMEVEGRNEKNPLPIEDAERAGVHQHDWELDAKSGMEICTDPNCREVNRKRGVKRTMAVNPTDAEIEKLEELDPGGWIVTDANGNRFRTWKDGYSSWTEKRVEATRYYRREDAESVHRDDEDAWSIVRFSDRSGEEDWKTCPNCFDVWNAK